MIEISARGQAKRVPLASFDLVDRRKGQLNSLGAILLGMASGRKLIYSVPNATKMKRLRDLLRNHLGLIGDPFHSYRLGNGWVPRFTVRDKRGAADERAKRDAELRTDSYDERLERDKQVDLTDQSDKDFADEGDPAGLWLSTRKSGEQT